MIPIYELDGQWWFWGLDGLIGPYSTAQRAEEKWWTYLAYVVEAPTCHHPHPAGAEEIPE